ncbi:MAG: ATP-binding protein [Flavobacterium sp.]
MTFNFKKLLSNILVIFFLISNSICFGFQNSKIKADSIGYYLEKNNSLKAINYARIKSSYYLKNKNYTAYCNMMAEKCEIYKNLNDNENALKALYEARDIAEKNKLLESQALIYRWIGNINGIVFEYTKAKKYLHKAEKIALKLNNDDLLCKVSQGLFKIYSETQSDSSEYYLRRVSYYTSKSNNLDEKRKNHANFYNYYISKKQYELAKKHIDSAYAIAIKLGNKNDIASIKNNLGVYYMSVEKNYEKGKQQYIDILKMFPNGDNPNALGNAYLNISYAYEKTGNYKKALDNTNEYLEIYDQILNGRLSQTTQEIETKYTINKIESEYKEKEKLIEEKQDRNQKLLLLFASLFILAGLISYFYYQNLVLKQKNKLKDIDNKLQYKIISATLDGQDQERNKISGVLHDHVSALLSSVGLHLSAFESNLNKEQIGDLKKTRLLLKDAHDKVRDLSHELVPPLLVKLGLQFALKDLCENNSNSLIKFEFHSALPKDRRFNPEFETKMFFIVSELLNNVMKHSNASKSKLSLEELSNKLHITIEDNGKGFDTKNISKSNGFGITQIRARVKNMNGDMRIHSKSEQGTKIDIKVDI